MNRLLEKIRKILRDRRVRRMLTRTISVFSAIIVFVTTYALILPAITVEKQAACGIEEHQHTEDCYEKVLICDLPESEGHQHTDGCYSVKSVLSCDVPEHVHDEDCYDENGDLICGAVEHVHDESCNQEVEELTCSIEESEGHRHDASCYEKVLTCGKEAHIHSIDCYEADENTGSRAESQEDGEPAAADEMIDEIDEAGDLSFEDDEDSVQNASAENYVPELAPLNMDVMLNEYTGVYYYQAQDGEEIPENSADITDWTLVKEDTELASTDLVKLYFAYMIPAGSLNGTNPVARYRLPENVRLTDGQIEAINKNENGFAAGYEKSSKEYEKYLGAEAIEGIRRPDEQLEDDADEFISAVVIVEETADGSQELVFTFLPYSIEKNQNTYDVVENIISAGQMITGWFACDFTLEQIDWVEEETQQPSDQEDAEISSEEDTAEGTEEGGAATAVEKTADIIFVPENREEDIEEISTTLRLVEQKEEEEADPSEDAEESEEAADDAASEETSEDAKDIENTEETEDTENTKAVEDSGDASGSSLSTDETGQQYKDGTLTTEGDGYKITLDYTAEAQIPEGAELSVREITADTDRETYEQCLEQAGKQVAADDNSVVDQETTRFFDIEILVRETGEDGAEALRKIEPAAPVGVNIQLDPAPAAQDSRPEQSDPTVLHFAKEGVEQIDSTVNNSPAEERGDQENEQSTEVRFEAESFSIYGVVYTVDFHYEINGKTVEFSIPGGGFVSLEHVVEVLGIASANEDTENEAENAENGAENKDDFAGEMPGEDLSDENGAAYEEAIKLNEVEVSEATKKFVADVESVEFSSPELVWVGKVYEASTVGEIKESRGLEAEYSAELTEEQIAEINAQTVESGDWALISIYPFDTEERLIVTMKNGDVFTIQVTDDNVEMGSKFFRDILDGKYFYLYTFYEGDQGSNMAATRGDYYLKYDGSAKRLNQYMHNIDNDVIDELGNDYLWQIVWEDDSENIYGGAWKIRNMGQPDYYLTLEDYYTITSNSDSSGINILAKTADGTDALLFLGNADEEYYEYYESQFDFSGFSLDNEDTELKLVFNSSTHTFDIDTSAYVYLGATIKAVSVDNVQPVITFTQDDITNGAVSFTDEAGTLHETGSTLLTISQDTMSSGQARYLVTAEPADGYHLSEWQVVSGTVAAWGSSSGKTAQSLTIQPVIEGGNAVIKAVFEPNQMISVTQNDIGYGHVEYNNGTDTISSDSTNTTINVLTVGPNTEGDYRALYNISAVPADDYRFVKWEAEGAGRVVSWGKDNSMTEYSTQISPYVTEGTVTLKAVFERIPTGTTLDPSTEAGQLVSQLMRELREDSADFRKTAHVVDEDKRIFQVNLSASSERKVIGPDITLSFITDISRSMYFPANLTPVTYTNYDNVKPNNLENWLKGHGRNSDGTYNTYYMIADINGTATILALFHDTDGNWKTMDASYYDDIFHDGERIGTSNNYRSAPPNSRKGGFSNTYLQNNNGTYRIRTGGSYNGGYSSWYPITDLDNSGNIRLYTASSTSDQDGVYFTRLDYLKKAVNIISDVVYAVDEDAEIGLITFAKKSYTRDEYGNRVYSSPEPNSYVAELYGKDDGFPGLDNIVLTGGTRQDHGLETANDMNWYGANPDHPQVAILITDGAPNTTDSGNYSDPWGQLINPRATDLKNRDVELYTLGLSLENVGNNKQALYKIAGKKGDNPGTWNGSKWSGIDGKYQNNAETGEETIERLMDILRSLEITGNLVGTVSDTVDPAFYPVDSDGYPLQEGVYVKNSNGTVRLGDINDYLQADGKPRQRIRGTYTPNPLYNEKNTIEYFTWTEDDGVWTITWYNQLIETVKPNGDAGWTDNFQVKAKEDFLGGNAINTNEGEATISADRFKQKKYPETIGSFAEPVTASVATPRVNVVELLLDDNSTEWTVYLDTSVNSRQELEALYDQIPIYERVTKADSDNRIDTTGEHCLPGVETGSDTIPFSEVLPLSPSEWDRLMSGETITHHYEAYGHMDVGVIKVELIREGLSRKTVHLGEHPASPVGDESEKYTLKVTYTPNPEDASTIWNTTSGESRGRPASSDAMVSENHHTVNVFAEPIQVLKKDDSGEDVRGATFSLYRKAKTGETGVSLAAYDETLTDSYYCISSQTTNADGIATLALPSDGQNSKNLLVPGEEYYLIETAAPANYKQDMSVRIVTVETAYESVTDLSGESVSTSDYPFNREEGVIIKVDGTPAVIVDTSGNPVTLEDDNGNTGETEAPGGIDGGTGNDGEGTGGRLYVLSSDPVLFQTTVLNMRITDFRFKKVSQDGSGLQGAVFQLKAIKNGAEVLVTEDSDYADITGISETVEIEVNGETKTFSSAFLTTGNEQIIGSLKDGTYILEEAYVPAGYVKTIGKIRFVIERGIMRMDMGTPLPDDIVFVPGRQTINDPTLAFLTVKNISGAALPNTGGPGTRLFTILGAVLTAGAGLLLWRRRRTI